jgi:holo-ACP synthase CitX
LTDLPALRRRLLEAREARQAIVDRAVGPAGPLLIVAANLPGADKSPPGLDAFWSEALRAIEARLPVASLEAGRDAMGPWTLYRVRVEADTAKRTAVEIEGGLPGGRLLDLDVVSTDGRRLGRASLGLPPRPCLLCAQPAFECIRLKRHSGADVERTAARLVASSRLPARRLAACLVRGARAELDLTPKPGLVDRLDNGSHPDLSFDDMSRSIDLLPAYFDELLALDDPLDLPACVAAGTRAELRMVDAVGANAHKGYIFLAGLVLLAARAAADHESLRSSVSTLARRILDERSPPGPAGAPPSHGARARADHGVGGILDEALRGLPSVFERGLPGLATSADGTAGHLLMAVLMQSVEDTTAVHRCGPDGLARLRADGLRLERMIESGEDCLPWLTVLNDEYRRLNLTMGGVADCMALCFALHEWFGL